MCKTAVWWDGGDPEWLIPESSGQRLKQQTLWLLVSGPLHHKTQDVAFIFEL